MFFSLECSFSVPTQLMPVSFSDLEVFSESTSEAPIIHMHITEPHPWLHVSSQWRNVHGIAWLRPIFLSSCCCGCLVAKLCPTLFWPHALQPAKLLCPWDFSGKNTGEGCHFLLQGILLTQKLNLRLLHWPVDSLPLNHQGSPSPSRP